MRTMTSRAALPLVALLLMAPATLCEQTAAPSASSTAAPRQNGTVKAVTPNDFVLTSASGQDFAVNVSASTRILLVDPATRDIKAAQPGTVADIAGGDKAIVTGTTGDTGQTLTATRVYLLKSGAIAAMHAGEQAAWARSVGGIVKTTDATTGTLTAVNGTRTYTINTSPTTVVRRYAGGSVRFEDAVKSSVTEVKAGDQVQARGQRSPDGLTVTADEIVTGSFSNFSGVLTAVDPLADTVTLKDLATKQTVTIALSTQTNLRKLPPGFGEGVRGAGAGAGSPAGQPRAGNPGSPATGSPAGGAAAGGRRIDLSRVMARLPTEAPADLKTGEAVMIVASNNAETGRPTAITMVSGVEQILAASPNGQTTLSPWSLGGGEGVEGSEGGGGAR